MRDSLEADRVGLGALAQNMGSLGGGGLPQAPRGRQMGEQEGGLWALAICLCRPGAGQLVGRGSITPAFAQAGGRVVASESISGGKVRSLRVGPAETP